MWLKSFSAEQQFYGNVCGGKVWLKCIWQSFKTDLIEGNTCQHLEPWTGVVQSPQIATNTSRSLLLARNWTHFESNHSAELAYSVVVLPASGTLCQKWSYFCNPKSTASCTSKDLPQKMGRNTKCGKHSGVMSSPGWILFQMPGSHSLLGLLQGPHFLTMYP